MAIDYPPVFINNYLSDSISQDLPDYFSNGVKFFPTQPTSIETLTEEFPDASEEPFAVYDRMFRMRRGPFPYCRTEQLLYYFYKTAGGVEALIETSQAVADLLDNGDDSAKDINYWIKKKHSEQGKPTEKMLPREISTRIEDYTLGMTAEEIRDFREENSVEYPVVQFGNKTFFLPYFHETKIYQLEEARDIIDFGTARTYAGNKIIIEYVWHKVSPT